MPRNTAFETIDDMNVRSYTLEIKEMCVYISRPINKVYDVIVCYLNFSFVELQFRDPCVHIGLCCNTNYKFLSILFNKR